MLPFLIDTTLADLKDDSQIIDMDLFRKLVDEGNPIPAVAVARLLIRMLMNEDYKDEAFTIGSEGVQRIIPQFQKVDVKIADSE